MSDTSPAGFDLKVVDRLLSTTRAVRRRLDFERPVEPEVLLECIRLSQQAPTSSNSQSWRWLVVADPSKKAALAEIYARGRSTVQQQLDAAPKEDLQTRRVYETAAWLCDHIHEVPALVIPCVVGRPPAKFNPLLCATIYGSILPAVWSFQLALRSRGLGSVFTTLHLFHEEEVRRLFDMPDDVLQAALLPVAYTRGVDFTPTARPPAETITFWNRWDESP
ncbi:MAG: nitroreductase family protein [Deltaproteobacteria bacterium]|nr:nitroreductase family protein [Deltaproteobacteria bacterium]MBW2399869.1 nitroreductase family protein [Deltaproteobacteria bacterium]